MKNFKDTVYSIFLGEDVVPPTTPPLRGIGDDSGKGRPTTKEKAPTGYSQEEWDKITNKYDEDMKRIDQEAQAKTQQGVKDTSVTSGGVKRSLTAAEAQQAAKAAGVVSPHGNARPGDGQLTPDERARVNQVQQHPGDTRSRVAFQDQQQIDKSPKGMLAPRPAGFNPYQHVDGMRDEEGPPPDSRTPEQIKVEDEEMRSRSRELLNDIIIKNAKQKEFDLNSTPNDRQKLDNEQRAKNGLPPRSQSDFDLLDKDREARKTKAKEKEEERNTPEAVANRKAKNAAAAADRRAKREAHNEKMQSATFERGSNGVQRMVRPGSGGGGNGGGGGGFGGGGAGSNGVQRMGRLGSNRTQGSNGINNYGSAGSQTSPDPDGPGAGGSNFDIGTTEVNLNPVNAYGTVNGTVLTSEKREGETSQSGISTSAGGKMIDQPFGIEVSNDKQQNYTNPKTGNVGRYSGTKKLPSSKLPGTMTDGYSHNKALTFFAEQLKRKYIEEEVVNPENQPMTKSEISHRDRIRHKSPAKDARAIKGSDTQTNAAYRLATYITMRGRKGKKKENK